MEFIKREIQKIRASSLAKNAGWMLVSQISSYAAQAAYFIVLSRLLGATQFGVLAGATAFVGVLAAYGNMGSGIVFMRHVSADRTNCKLYAGNVFLASLSMSGVLILALWLMAPHLLDAQGASIVWMVAISGCLCSPLLMSISQMFQTYEMPKAMAAFSFIGNSLRFVVALAFILIVHKAQARQWAMADKGISLLIVAGSVSVVVRYFGMPRFSLRLLPRSMTEGLGYSISMSAESIYNNFDRVMLNHYGMNAANGIYTLAYRISNLATMPINSIEMAAIPRMFQRAANSMRELESSCKALLERSILLGAVVSAFLYLAAPAVPYIAGSGFQSSVLALRWLCLLPLFRSVHQITGSMLTASGHQRYRVAAQFTVAGLNLALNLWLIPAYGWLGAAWASLAADATLGLMSYTLLKFAISRALIMERTT